MENRFGIDYIIRRLWKTEVDRNEAGRTQVMQIDVIYIYVSATKLQSVFHI